MRRFAICRSACGRLGPRRNERAAGEAPVDRKVEVEADRQREAEALVAAALGRERDAALHRVLLAANLDRLALEDDGAGRLRPPAEDRHRAFAAAGADEAVEPDDLARAHAEGHIREPGAGEVLHVEERRAESDLLLVVDLLDRAVDHQPHQLGLVRLGDPARADEGAVAQDRDPRCELEHLLHAMADVDDRHAAAPRAGGSARRVAPSRCGSDTRSARRR